MIEDHFRHIESILASVYVVVASSITYDKRSEHVGFVRGEIFFLDSSRLHVREFVNTERGIERYTYAYHYQNADGDLVFRYDNTPHFAGLQNFPHHKHVGSEANVTEAAAPDLAAVLSEIQELIASTRIG